MNRQDSIRRDRSIDSVLNRLRRMKSDNREQFKSAMYNFLIIAGLAAFAAVCVILGPFLKPLLWAFLMGAVLFPFKRKLAYLLNRWFEELEEQDINIMIGISLGPLQTLEYIGRKLVAWLRTNWEVISSCLAVAVCLKLMFLFAPKGFLCCLWRWIMCSHLLFVQIIGYLNFYVLMTIIAMYVATVNVLWRRENSLYFMIAGQLIWLVIVSYGCSFFGALQIPAFFASMVYVGVAILYHFKKFDKALTIFEKVMQLMDKNAFAQSVTSIREETSDIDDISITETQDSMEPEDESKDKEKEELLSDLYFKMLFAACISTFLYRNTWMFIVAAIPISFHLTCKLSKFIGLTDFIIKQINLAYNIAKEWALEHHSAVLPLCLPGILELNHKTNAFVRNFLKSSIDLVTSILMIILMILIVIFLGVFFCVNIYSETLEVAYLGKDLVNRTITERPDLVDILPDNMHATIDEALDNAHHYGRRKLEEYVDQWLKASDTKSGQKLKQQILEVFDRLIQYWIDLNKSDTHGPRVPADALTTTLGDIVDNPVFDEKQFQDLVIVARKGFLGWAKQNTQTIIDVAESLWHIVKTNISMVMSFSGEIVSLILSGGQACIGFILDMIVLFSGMFYLLCSSDKKFAPLEVPKYLGFSTKISDTLESSISAVLTSMLKCALFQGLFAWLIHTLFGAKIVFLPSLLAALLSAAPFLGSYWCALPAFLELWLAEDQFYAGLSLFLLMFFIPGFVEEAIYSETKGGAHPYLMGLAIAGGLYWLGWQGAIFGPLMVCFFLGTFEVVSVALRAEESRRNSDEETRTHMTVCATPTNVQPSRTGSRKSSVSIPKQAFIKLVTTIFYLNKLEKIPIKDSATANVIEEKNEVKV